MQGIPQEKYIVLFDGVCNLCDNTVQKIISLDKKDKFRFASLQSEIGQKIIKHLDINTKHIDSVVLYLPGRAYYYKSDAIIEIARRLNNWFNILYIFSFLPRFLRDFIYDYIAKNRYKWYGKKESCMMPTPDLQSKFL